MTMPTSVRKRDGGRIGGPAAVPNVIEIRWQTQIPNGKVAFSTVHGAFATTPPAMQSAATALWGSISAAWNTNLAPHMHTATLFTAVQLRDMTNPLNPIFIGTGAAIAGSAVGAAMPPQNAIVLSENILSRGRGLKGRVYIGGWAASEDVTTGGISPAVQTALNAFGIALANAISTQTLTPCVAQVARAQYAGLTGTIHAARSANHVTVSTYTCRDLTWDTQRRRAQL